jgi:hypothetical protein
MSLADVHVRLSRSTEGIRHVYARARAVARLRQVVARRSTARRLGGLAGPRIPQDDGFAIVEPWTIPEIEPVVRLARALREATDISPLWTKSEGRNLLRVPLEPRLAEAPQWSALALHPSLLSTVSNYLGAVPLLSDAQLWISPYAVTAPDGRRLEHRYHCDWADLRQVRVLVFVNDVTPDHGPLTLIPARRSADVRRARRYTFGEAECTILDAALFAHVGREEERRLCGPAGTLAFADTSRCFHQGSRLRREGLERVMVMFQYLTVTAFKLPAEFTRRSPFAALATSAHSKLQRMVLGAG